jgi:outer membrane lipoprotein SlyB
MTPRHQAVLDAIPPGSSGRYLASIRGALAGKVPASDVKSILSELVAVGMLTRSSDRDPALFKRTEAPT